MGKAGNSWVLACFMACLVVGIYSPVQAKTWGKDLGFRYHHGLFVCNNSAGEPGHSPVYRGECGDHTGQLHRGEIFDDISLSGSLFVDTDLREASFANAELVAVKFTGANLQAVNFSRSRLIRADLRQVRIDSCSLYWANLQNARLEGADLSFCDLRGATLDLAWVNADTRFKGAVFDEYTALPFSRTFAKSIGMKFIASEGPE